MPSSNFGIPVIDTFGDAMQQLPDAANAIANVLNPHRELQQHLKEAMIKNPELIQQLSDAEANNPGIITKMFGSQANAIIGPQSAKNQIEQASRSLLSSDPNVQRDAATTNVGARTDEQRSSQQSAATIAKVQADAAPKIAAGQVAEAGMQVDEAARLRAARDTYTNMQTKYGKGADFYNLMNAGKLDQNEVAALYTDPSAKSYIQSRQQSDLRRLQIQQMSDYHNMLIDSRNENAAARMASIKSAENDRYLVMGQRMWQEAGQAGSPQAFAKILQTPGLRANIEDAIKNTPTLVQQKMATDPEFAEQVAAVQGMGKIKTNTTRDLAAPYFKNLVGLNGTIAKTAIAKSSSPVDKQTALDFAAQNVAAQVNSIANIYGINNKFTAKYTAGKHHMLGDDEPGGIVLTDAQGKNYTVDQFTRLANQHISNNAGVLDTPPASGQIPANLRTPANEARYNQLISSGKTPAQATQIIISGR